MEEYGLYLWAVKIIGAPVLVVLVLKFISRDSNSKEGEGISKSSFIFLVLVAPIVIAILTVPYVEKLNSI